MNIQIFLSSFTLKALLKFCGYGHFKDSELNLLLSYGTRTSEYSEMLLKHRKLFNDVILDSGAFTINNSGNLAAIDRLSRDGFRAFCRRLPKDLFKFIINYDEIFTPDGFEINFENMQILEEDGIKIIPVVHDYTGKVFDEMESYLKKGYPLIALGWATDKRKQAPNAVKRIASRGRKMHLLGGTSYDMLKRIPVNYCDSSNWTQAVRFGYIYHWNESNKDKDPLKADMTDTIRFWDKENQARKNSYYFDDYPWKKDLAYYLKEMFGLTWKDLHGHDKHLAREVVNIHYFTILQEKLRQYHKRNNIFGQQESIISLRQDLGMDSKG